MGPGAVSFGWVKAHVGTRGNELANQLAKEGATLSEEWGVARMVTEAELRQRWKKMREEGRKVKGTGMGMGKVVR